MKSVLTIVVVVLATVFLGGCPMPVEPAIPSANATLSALSLAEAVIAPDFSPGTTSYTAVVPNGVASVNVNAAAAASAATIVSGLGTCAVAEGLNILEVVVRAESGATKTYTITVSRAAPSASARTFRAQGITDIGWYDVQTTLLGSALHVDVYADDSASIPAATAQAIADEFDASIYETIRTNFGYESDVDANGKVIVLLLDIVDGFSGSGGYVAGYFDPTHLFSTATYPNSNMADMLFMDVYPGVAASAEFYATLSHELQHLVNYSNTYLVDGTAQDIWINEGLSSGAEFLYAGAQIDSKISYFNTDPLLTIRHGNNFYVWNGYWEIIEGDILANYSTVYLFFQWLQIHSTNRTGIYKEILLSSFRDQRAVVAAAMSLISTGLSSWESVLSTWLQANLLNRSSGLQGYKGEISTAPWQFFNTGGLTWPLSSGESLAIQTSGGYYTYTGGSGASIRYVGLNTSTGATDIIGSRYDGDLVVVYNGNSIIAAADQTAVLPATLPIGVARLSVAITPTSDFSLPSSYPIDVSLQPGGGLRSDSHRPSQVRPAGSADVLPIRRWSR